MSLYTRIVEGSGDSDQAATKSKDQAFRTDIGWVVMPLNRKLKKGEFADPERFQESDRLLEKYDGRKGPKFKALKKGKCKLDPDERKLCMDRKAVWHFHMIKGGTHVPTPAVWKSKIDGKTWYVTNTHRAYNVTSTLKGTIKQFHDFIRGTA